MKSENLAKLENRQWKLTTQDGETIVGTIQQLAADYPVVLLRCLCHNNTDQKGVVLGALKKLGWTKEKLGEVVSDPANGIDPGVFQQI
jgi:hypothetical protein